MQRIITFDEVQTICKALRHWANAYALCGNYSKSNQLISLGDKLSDIAGAPEDWIKIKLQ